MSPCQAIGWIVLLYFAFIGGGHTMDILADMYHQRKQR